MTPTALDWASFGDVWTLGARVQGDDGEFYGPDGEPVEDDGSEPPKRGLFRRLRRP